MKDRVCENKIGRKTCGGPAYSWSAEHGNRVLCVACYEEFLANKDVNTAIQALSRIKDNPDALKIIKEAMKDGN